MQIFSPLLNLALDEGIAFAGCFFQFWTVEMLFVFAIAVAASAAKLFWQ